jgi:hypothetical protein
MTARQVSNKSTRQTRIAELCNSALFYASLDIRVFPVWPIDGTGHCGCSQPGCEDAGKHPAVSWSRDAITDPAQIRDWWRTIPYNIGAIPGPEYGVFDYDPRKSGERERLAALIAEHGELPETMLTKTSAIAGEHGWHRWYRTPSGLQFPAKIGGLEFKTSGFVVMAPSRHATGWEYELHWADIAVVPDWVLACGADVQSNGIVLDRNQLTRVQLGQRALEVLDQGFFPAPTDDETQRSLIVGVTRNLVEAGTPAPVVRGIIVNALLDPKSQLDPDDPWTKDDAEIIVGSVLANPAPDQSVYLQDVSLTARKRDKPVLDSAAHYGLFGDWVQELRDISTAHPAALLFQAIAAFGNIIGSRRHDDPAPGFWAEGARHRTALYILISGPSGIGGKGDSLSRVKEVFAHVDPKWKGISGVNTGEGLIDIAAMEQGESEHDTEDGVVRHAYIPTLRVFVEEREFSRVLHISQRQGSIARDVYREAWDNHLLAKITKSSKQHVENVTLSLIGHITKAELESDTTEVDQLGGFLARFLHVWSERKEFRSEAPSLDAGVRDEFVADLQAALQFARTEAPEHYVWTAKAEPVWDEICDWVTSQIQDGGDQENITTLKYSRAVPMIRRLAVILAVSNQAQRIGVQHIEAAHALWQYHAQTIEYLFGERIGDKDANKLYRRLQGHPAGLDQRDLDRAFGGHWSAAQKKRAFDILAQQGMIEEIPAAGSRKKIWRAI